MTKEEQFTLIIENKVQVLMWEVEEDTASMKGALDSAIHEANKMKNGFIKEYGESWFISHAKKAEEYRLNIKANIEKVHELVHLYNNMMK